MVLWVAFDSPRLIAEGLWLGQCFENAIGLA